MATRYGHQIASRLVEEHGWKWDDSPEPEEMVFGDRHVIDPVTGEKCSPYQAQNIQAERDAVA